MLISNAAILTLFLCAFSAANDLAQKARDDLIESNNKFSKNLFFDYAARTREANLIISPLSVWILLSMATYGARDQTFDQMKESLFLPKNGVYTAIGFSELTRQINEIKNIHLEMKNNLYISKDFKLRDQFKNIVNYFVDSEISTFDNHEPLEAANCINKWVSNATNKKIEKLINENDITTDLRMILLNAVYFKADWKTKFNPAYTRQMPFYYDMYNKKNVPTMSVKDNFFWGTFKDLEAKFIQLPYKNEGAQMTIIVPDKSSSFQKLIENLHLFNTSIFEESGVQEEVRLTLPKFKIDSDIDLKESLKQLGMKDMFTDEANFLNMSEEQLEVSKVKQKAFIEVNEEGSEAAASTAVMMLSRMLGSTIDFKVNRPSLFFITVEKMILFMGRIGDPIY